MKILIVDDCDVTLEILDASLSTRGYAVERAENAEQALSRINKGDIRLVVSDWEMPGMSGLELCEEVRRTEHAGYVYFILLTSCSSSDDVVRGLTAGADDFIVKPFNNAELLARVRTGERVLAQESREMVIFALAKLAESRDPETGHHLERVQRYSCRLAETLAESARPGDAIDASFIRLVYQTSPLHDIGKVGIPDGVLLKAGRLTSEEFEIMKTHTTIGAETLSAALANYPQARFLQVARDIAASHHERWNGTGYPLELRGTQIPLAARIVAVADVYDALTSRRVYKEAYSHQHAYDVITAESGAHFDPWLVEAFRRVHHDFDAIRTRFTEVTGRDRDEGQRCEVFGGNTLSEPCATAMNSVGASGR